VEGSFEWISKKKFENFFRVSKAPRDPMPETYLFIVEIFGVIYVEYGDGVDSHPRDDFTENVLKFCKIRLIL
jgi:hypothetical protein